MKQAMRTPRDVIDRMDALFNLICNKYNVTTMNYPETSKETLIAKLTKYVSNNAIDFKSPTKAEFSIGKQEVVIIAVTTFLSKTTVLSIFCPAGNDIKIPANEGAELKTALRENYIAFMEDENSSRCLLAMEAIEKAEAEYYAYIDRCEETYHECSSIDYERNKPESLKKKESEEA